MTRLRSDVWRSVADGHEPRAVSDEHVAARQWLVVAQFRRESRRPSVLDGLQD